MHIVFSKLLKSCIRPNQQKYLKKKYLSLRARIIKEFYSYTREQLENALRNIGLEEGDTVLMHSSFSTFNGFKGSPAHVIDSVLNVIGNSGNLLMMSMDYTGSSYSRLQEGKPFNIKKSPSRMGIITEIFRRRENVLRSLNPIHPILAYGPQAEWLVNGHDKTLYSCGEGSPFEKIFEINAKILFFDVDVYVFTFLHYVEFLIKDRLPFNLYRENILDGIIIDSEGKEIKVRTYVFNSETVKKLNQDIVKKELIKNKMIKIDKIGNTEIMCVSARQVVDCARKMVNAGKHFYND